MSTKYDKAGGPPTGAPPRGPLHHRARPQKPWPVLTRRQDAEGPKSAAPAVEVAERPGTIPADEVSLQSSSPSFSGVHEASPLVHNGMTSERLWELAALGESLSGELPQTPYSPLPASTTVVPPSVEVEALLPDVTDEAEADWQEAEKSWREPEVTATTPRPLRVGDEMLGPEAPFEVDGSFAQIARPTLQLTPPTYRTPRSSRRPSLHLWYGMSRVLSTSYVRTRRHPRTPNK